MRLTTQYRFAGLEAERLDNDARTLELTFSSEAPVERPWGKEILSHEKGAVRLERLNSRAPLLFNHNLNDVIGVVERAYVSADRRGHAIVRFAKNGRGEEIMHMVRDGILANVSVGYRIHAIEERPAMGEFRVVDWEPLEVSIVTVPSDTGVGIGRDAEKEFEVRMVRISSPADSATTAKEQAMKDDVRDMSPAAGTDAADGKQLPPSGQDKAMDEQIKTAMRSIEQKNAIELEAARRRAIENLAKANKIADSIRDAWVNQGYSLEEVSKDLLQILEERGKSNPQPASRLGLTPAETQRFSLARAIIAAASKDWKTAGFELECSRAVAQKLGRIAEDHKFYVPFEVMERPLDQASIEMLQKIGRRDLTAATAGAGGYLVSTDNVGFIEILRNRSVAFRMGARRLSGLQGNVTIPRQSASATAYWLSTEATQITESQQTFVQIALSPKNVGAYTEISRQLLLQASPGVEGIVSDDLAQVVATAADLAVLEGSGASGQPTGIANTSGIGAVSGTSLGYAGVLEFQTDVAAANVTPVRGGYVTTPAVAALMMQRSRFSNTDTPLWVGNIWDGQMAGFPAMSSNQISTASMIFGDWQEVVVAEWGVLEVEVNPYANFQAGIIGVRAMYSLDVGVRRPFAFSRATSIT